MLAIQVGFARMHIILSYLSPEVISQEIINQEMWDNPLDGVPKMIQMTMLTCFEHVLKMFGRQEAMFFGCFWKVFTCFTFGCCGSTRFEARPGKTMPRCRPGCITSVKRSLLLDMLTAPWRSLPRKSEFYHWDWQRCVVNLPGAMASSHQVCAPRHHQ